MSKKPKKKSVAVVENKLPLELHELLDRYEILYPDVSELADLRRTVIDKDIASIFRLCKPQPILRSAVLDKNLPSIFKLFGGADDELRKAVIEENWHSIFRVLEKSGVTIENIDDLRRATVEKNLHSLFRVLETYGLQIIDDLRKAVLEKSNHHYFKLYTYKVLKSIDEKNRLEIQTALDANDYDALNKLLPDTEDLRRAIDDQNLHSLFRLLEEYTETVGAKRPMWHIDDLRRAFVEDNLYSLFRLLPEDNEQLNTYRTAIVNKNLRSVFRLLPEDEDIRRAVTEENLHSLFRLLNNDDLRKLILENNLFKVWSLLEKYTNTQFTAAFKNFFINNTSIDTDCFARGQLLSKQWLLKELTAINKPLGTVFLCAGWYGTLATMLFESKLEIKKIRSFDIDPSTIDIAKIFNKPWVMKDWQFQASLQDIMTMSIDDFTYTVSRSDGSTCELTDSADTVINTSCEHLPEFDKWYRKIPKGKLVVLQANDFNDLEEHVNTYHTLEDFSSVAPMTKVHYEGELKLEKYTRFMKIGIR